MNQEKNRNFKKKQVDSKKRRMHYQKQNQEKPHYRQQYQKKKNPTYFYQKKDKEPENYVYKQDLIQVGFQASEKAETQNKELTEKYPAVFNTHRRKVIIQKKKKTDVQKVDNLEEIKKDFKKLIENEDIPDWFLDEEEQQEVQENTFDFGDTVQRTVSFQKDLERVHQEHGPLQQNLEIIGGNFDENDEDFSDLQDMDFAQLDAYLEKKAQKIEQEAEPVEPVQDQNCTESSNEHSADYFDNLEKNIKNMLESSKEDFEDDSDESFAEQLGFNYESDMNKNPNVLPLTKNQQPQIVIEDHQEEQLSPQKESKDEDQNLSQEKSQEQKPVVSPEELEMRKKFFMQKYGYLDQILCQLVYEIFNSKRKLMLNKMSVNGFDQESVEKYCQNDYKIFSMYTQGNILPKIWYYKDQDEEVKGPFMSYDMDIWNGQKDFFAPTVQISVSGENYMPIELYLYRDPQVIQVVEEVLFKLNRVQESAQQQKMKHQQKRYRKNNNRQQQTNRNQQGSENEEFPALGNAQKSKTSHGQSLISTLTQKDDQNQKKETTQQKIPQRQEDKKNQQSEKVVSQNKKSEEIKEDLQQQKNDGDKIEQKKTDSNLDLQTNKQQNKENSRQSNEVVLNQQNQNDQSEKQNDQKNSNRSKKDQKKNNKNNRKKDKKKQSQRDTDQIYYKKKNQTPKKKMDQKNEELTNDLKNLLGL